MDIFEHNRRAWNHESTSGTSPWCKAVDAATIERARRGDWSVWLTPNRPVPRSWFGELSRADVLCLASSGGQQAPILAAAGARVTSFDASEEQLAKDGQVAEREGLDLGRVQGDMADLSAFDDASFDVVFQAVSNVFAADLRPVWSECYRVLRPGGRLLCGFMNPSYFLFDHDGIEQGAPLEVRFRLPYSDVEQLSEQALAERTAQMLPLQFGHSLDAQLGGQLAAGFTLFGFYEDDWSDAATPLNRHMPTSMATLSRKLDPRAAGASVEERIRDDGVAVSRGDVFWIAPDESRGSVPGVAHPHLVIQDDVFNQSRVSTIVVCALTTNLKRAHEPGNVLLDPGEGNLPKQSVLVVSQVSSVERIRFGERIGTLSVRRIEQVLDGMRFQQSAFFRR